MVETPVDWDKNLDEWQKAYDESNIPMTWNKFTGTVKGKKSIATCELIEADGEPEWFCMHRRSSDEFGAFTRDSFKAGELEKAHNWCVNEIIEYER